MCSISGILCSSHFEPGNAELKSQSVAAAVERMNTALKHRGPDDHGIAQLPDGSEAEFQVCLGNTRLAVIDTTPAGHQPMHDPQTGNWITYSGETYNFRELRREIGDEFGPWHSHTDTEVVLRAYGKWGVEALGRLRGMFALAIWDAGKEELILARDPFGIKPLYYAEIPQFRNSFIFASEVRALLASGLLPRNICSEGVDSYLSYGSVQAPLTIVDGVRSLMPGEGLRVSAKGIESFAFQIAELRTCDSTTSQALTEESRTAPATIQNRDQAVAQLRVELEESVRLHLVSDVPLGVFLSGGMDSSALVALMSRVSEEKPKTFSVVFDEEKLSESPHSRLVAEKFHTDHSEVHLDENRLLEMLPAALSSLDQPTIDGINTYVVSKAVKDAGITVALSGLGGDELFAGYPSFSRALKLQSVSAFTKAALRLASGFGKLALNGSVQRAKFWQLAESDCKPQDVYRISRQLFAPNGVARLLDCETAQLKNGGDALRSRTNADSGEELHSRHTAHSTTSLDPINTISQLELQGYMANTLLRDTDVMSMAHSLEVRVPFVDVNVVNYVLSLPGEWKLNGKNGGLPKALLADAVSDLLPRKFLSRPKMGFTLPFEKWMQSRMRNEVSGVLEDKGRLAKAGLDSDEAGKIWQRFLGSPQAIGWSRPWALYVLAIWCEINL
jgi:asparagine synthase (glutamine-hydrolysing)